MKRFVILLTILNIITLGSFAFALSCAPPQMTQEIYDASAAVFEGEALEEKEKGPGPFRGMG